MKHEISKWLLTLSATAMALVLAGCADNRHHILVSVPEQRMVLLDEGQPVGWFRVSTSKFGYGDDRRSNFTPMGRLEVARMIGGGQPSGMKFKSRVPTGEIVPVNAPGRDPIVTRILWLRGLDAGNQNSHGRYIYIHGTPEEWKLGTRASYGCVRMASRDIIWLYDQIGRKTKVDILPHPLTPQLLESFRK